MKRLDCSVLVKGKVTGKVRNSGNFHQDNISSTAEPFVTKLDMVRWEDNFREWTGLEFGKSQRAVENREK